MPRRTIGQALFDAATYSTSSVTFWSDPGQSTSYTYRALLEKALSVAAALQARGLQAGETVAIVLPTAPEFYSAFFGVSLAGGVPTALYPPARLGRVDEWKARTAKMLTVSDSVAVLSDRALTPLLGEPVRLANPRMGHVTVSRLETEGADRQPSLGHECDLAAIQFSSGSTGHPKPVALSHENMLTNAETILNALPVGPGERSGVSWLPLYHDMGLIGCLLSAVVGGAPLTLIGPERFVAKPIRWLQALSETKATVSVAPNFAFGLTHNKVTDEQMAQLDLSHWKVALCGAEPVHPRTMEGFATRFETVGFDQRAITPVYGLAEATLAVTFSNPKEAPRWARFDEDALDADGVACLKSDGRLLSSLGTPLPGCDIQIRNAEGGILGADRVGHVFAHGPSIMVGYLNDPEKTQDVLCSDGWLNTGDTGFIHEGELYLCGRSKDLIIMNGRNHDPAMVEQTLDGIDGVRPGCVAAFAAHDEESDTERLVVLAEVAQGSDVDHEGLVKTITQHVQRGTSLPVYRVGLLAPGTLPRTSSGKIRRQEAGRLWMRQELSAARDPSMAFIAKEMASGVYHHLRFKASRLRLARPSV